MFFKQFGVSDFGSRNLANLEIDEATDGMTPELVIFCYLIRSQSYTSQGDQASVLIPVP